jgi:hypothetical protein
MVTNSPSIEGRNALVRTMLWSLAAAALFAIAACSAVPADAAKKRNKSTAGGQAATHVDSVDLSYVAGHGAPSQKSVKPRRLRAR